MNKALTIGMLVLGALALATALVLGGDRQGLMGGDTGVASPGANPHGAPAAPNRAGLPWDIQPLPGGAVRLFGPAGLVLSPRPGEPSTLADVQRLWPIETQVAIVAAPDEPGTLEAYVDPAQLGPLGGKLVTSARLRPEVLAGMRDRAMKVEFMGGTTRRFTLAPGDVAQALRAPVDSVSLLPQAQLDAATVAQRFGPPAQRVRQGEGPDEVEHLLYPALGLDVAVGQGRDLIQYVAPAHMDRLLAPLAAASAASRTQP